jgi:NNP family nitrate/nitrite transporter-like MFS transporter
MLGSLGRIPLGMMTDRFGGRLVFSLVMAFSAVPAFLMRFVSSYTQLVLCGFFIGGGWYPPQKQGLALGVYGAGNIGQSLAAFGSPVLAGAMGLKWGFWTFGVLLLIWLAVFLLKAENAPRRAPAKTFSKVLQPLRESKSWVLSLYYFLTFGGFVAMAIYLPIFLTDRFKLTPGDAGLRTAGFVLLATAMRPLGGSLADRIGGRKILLWVFPVTATMAIFLACPMMSTFTIGALGMAAAIGLGNGAVFKLVPDIFRNRSAQ